MVPAQASRGYQTKRRVLHSHTAFYIEPHHIPYFCDRIHTYFSPVNLSPLEQWLRSLDLASKCLPHEAWVSTECLHTTTVSSPGGQAGRAIKGFWEEMFRPEGLQSIPQILQPLSALEWYPTADKCCHHAEWMRFQMSKIKGSTQTASSSHTAHREGPGNI